MPVSPTIPNCVQLRLLWTIGGQGAVNVLNFRATGAVVVNQALAEQLASVIKPLVTTHLGTLMAGNVALVRVGVRDKRTPAAAEFLDTAAAVGGTAVADTLPAQIAACVTLRTAGAGKSFRGRSYISGFCELQNNATGDTASTASTAATNFIAAIRTGLSPLGLTMAVATRGQDPYTIVKTTTHANGTTTARTIGRGADLTADLHDVTAVQSRNNSWETQRRRNNGRGAAPTTLVPVASVVF